MNESIALSFLAGAFCTTIGLITYGTSPILGGINIFFGVLNFGIGAYNALSIR